MSSIQNQYGLIGFPLSHSFSGKYFAEKFAREGIAGSAYNLFELESADELPGLVANTPNLRGLNVTIPHKQAVMPHMARLDESAQMVGAVNVIKVMANGDLVGYNSDYYGFKASVEPWMGSAAKAKDMRALILGTGGASLAVKAALKSMGIPYAMVSRSESKGDYTYDTLNNDSELFARHRLVVNTTPVGTSPKVHEFVPLPYEAANDSFFFYDLVYNPEVSAFLGKGKAKGAAIKNGLEMLHLQAEKSWEIWNA